MLDPVIANSTVAAGQCIVAVHSDFKIILLLTGLMVLTGGLWLLWLHRQQLGQRLGELKPGKSMTRFEHRKFQRRNMVGGLVTSCGIVMTGFYWLQEGKAFAILLALLLLLIVGITIIAVLEMVSVGLKHGIEQLAESDTETDQAIAAAIAKHHEANQQPDASTDDN